MAYEIGSATDYIDLMNKVATFATTNNWTVTRNTTADATDQQLALSGPNGDVHVGMVALTGTDTVNTYEYHDYYNWQLQTFDNWDDALHVNEQVGAVPTRGYLGVTSASYETQQLSLSNSPMRYWLFVNDRRITMTVRVLNSNYVNMYLGLLDPLASSAEYPSPQFVGGNITASSTSLTSRCFSITVQHNTNINTSISSQPDHNSNWMFATGSTTGHPMVKRPDGTWLKLKNNDRFYAKYYDSLDATYGKIWPFNSEMRNLGKNIDGSYPVFKALVVSELTSAQEGNWYGYANGIFAVPGEDMVSESIITDQDGVQYIVFQNVFRDWGDQYYAMELA